MRHILRTIALCAMMMAAGTQQADAQLGNLLKKAKKAVNKVENISNTLTGQPDTTTNADGTTTTTTTVAATPTTSGGTVENPLASVCEFDLVGAYGKSTSLNYGTVYLVLKVKMIANKSKVGLGGDINGVSSMAVDQDGNAYKTGTMGQFPKDVTEGLAVKVKLDEKDAHFLDVKKTAKTMQLIRLGCFIDANNKGVITFRNVPVLWDVEPE